MNKLTVTSTLAALSLLACAAPALAQTAPDPLAVDLEEMATVFGDANDHLSFLDATGQTRVLAYEQRRSYVVYTAGNAVSGSDVFAFCTEDVAGGLSSCDVVDGNDPSEFTCGTFTCACYTPYDCFMMTISACHGPLDCLNPGDPLCTCAS